MKRTRATLHLLRDTYLSAQRHRVARLSAAIAFYTIFSLAPLIVIIVSLAGLTIGVGDVEGRIVSEARELFGPRAAQTVEDIVDSARRPAANAVAAAVGFAVLLFGASRVFVQLQDAMNTIFESGGRRGVRSTIRSRAAGFAMVVIAGAAFFLGLAVQAAMAAVRRFLAGLLPGVEGLLVAGDWIVAFVLTATLIAAVFRYVPRAPVGWRDVWPGAILSTFLFLAGRLLLAFYLRWGAMSSIQGAVGSVVVLLFWIYFMAQVVFLGAEFTRLYANRFGSGTRSTP